MHQTHNPPKNGKHNHLKSSKAPRSSPSLPSLTLSSGNLLRLSVQPDPVLDGLKQAVTHAILILLPDWMPATFTWSAWPTVVVSLHPLQFCKQVRVLCVPQLIPCDMDMLQ